MNYSDRHINENGVVLVSALLFMAIITIAGTSAYFTSSNELQISGNYKRMKQSFYDAEAGVTYTLAKIEKELSDENLTLTNSTETISYPRPDGFSFDPVTTLTQVSSNKYQFQVTGNEGGTSTTLEIEFERDSKVPYGLFGDSKLDIYRYLKVYSYDSNDTPNPAPTDSTNEADIGSNGEVEINHRTEIDGNIDLGNATDSTEAILTQSGVPIVQGTVKDVDRVNPDPLGAVGGELENDFTNYAVSNDNLSAGIAGTSVNIASGDTVNMITGNYYFTDVTVDSGGTWEIDASGGPVNIYLSGPLLADIGSSVNITGPPTNVNFYSDSTDSIFFGQTDSLKGMIYAPFSDIDIRNFSDIFGAIWGKTIKFYYPGKFYYDTAIKNNWLDDTVSVMSWKDMRYE